LDFKTMRIGFIGFGEAARAFVDTLGEAGAKRFSAYDILFDTEGMDGATANLARQRGVHALARPADIASESDWVFCAVTAASSLDAATAIAPHLVADQIFVDINSVSPGRKRACEGPVTASGATYVDMAVMAPVHPRGHRTPSLLAGAAAQGLAPRFAELGFDVEVVGDAVGEATAIKMVRSLFVKGLEALTVEMLLAARASGCFERVVSSLAATYPGLGWERFAGYEVERVARHGVRRGAEMEESAVTLRELGLSGDIAAAVAATQARIGMLGFRPEGTIEADVDRLLAALGLSASNEP
jgi:3-hydroxyisobutyrate dehydrogenase-like beta-hydroxyacid dehydrogenase